MSHPGGTVCGVNAGRPEKFAIFAGQHGVRAKSKNHCYSPATYQEVYASLQDRFRSRWRNLDSEYAKRSGPGTIETPFAWYDCFHFDTREYRNEGMAYSVVRGRGYVGVNRKYLTTRC